MPNKTPPKKSTSKSKFKHRDERKTPNSGYPEPQGRGNKIRGYPDIESNKKK